MRPSNEFTTPNQIFFFPPQREAEYHESLDTANLPAAEVLADVDAYAVVHPPNGVEVAYNAHFSGHNIPAGSTITKITTINEDNGRYEVDNRPYYRPGEFSIFEGRSSYTPSEGDLLVVAANVSSLTERGRELVGINGLMIVQGGQALPTFAKRGLVVSGEAAPRYKLYGVITATDKLVDWQGKHSSARRIVDLCVASALARSRMELALVASEIGAGSLLGQVKVRPAVAAYLAHFDRRHSTNFTPHKDPWNRMDEFPESTGEERSRYKLVTDEAFRLRSQPWD